MNVCECKYVHVCIDTCMYCMYECICILFMYMYLYACMYVYVSICICKCV